MRTAPPVRRRSRFALLGLLLVLPGFLLTSGAIAATGDVTRVSTDSSGGEANGLSQIHTGAENGPRAVSDDGSYVVFESEASDLVSGDTLGNRDIFRKNRTTGAIERVNVTSSAAEANGSASNPSINGDGRYVVFNSPASNLDQDGVPGSAYYRKDMVTGAVGEIGSAGGGGPATINGAGNVVGFTTNTGYDVANDTNGQSDVYRWTEGGTTPVLLSKKEDGTAGSGQHPSLNTSGDVIAFFSSAKLLAADTNDLSDIYVSAGGSIELLTPGGNENSQAPSISGDGRYVAFHSAATTLTAGSFPSGLSDRIYLYDRSTDVTILVSKKRDGSPTTMTSTYPVISRDGSRIIFNSRDPDLVEGDTNGAQDTFVYNIAQGTLERVSVTSAGSQTCCFHSISSISGDASVAVFSSDSSALVAGDSNNTYDVFAKELATGTPSPSPTPSATPSATPSDTPSATPSATPSVPASPSPSTTPTPTPSVTPSASASTNPAPPGPGPGATPSSPLPSSAPPSTTAPASTPTPASTSAPTSTPTVRVGPTLTVSDASVVEGHGGVKQMEFLMTLDMPSDQEVVVEFATLGGTAAPDVDFRSTVGTVTIPIGSTSAVVRVTILGDRHEEQTEELFLVLRRVVGAGVTSTRATGSIFDDDGLCSGLFPPGTKVVVGTAGNDRIVGTEGPDAICGLGGDDTLIGLGGDDLLRGGDGNDLVEGASGADGLFGDGGIDRLDGGEGSDLLRGGGGNDTALGGGGDDVFRADEVDGTDSFEGGPGLDTFSYEDRTIAVHVTLDGVANDGVEGENDAFTAEAVTGSAAGDLLVGGPGDDIIAGGGGADTIRGGLGHDWETGGDGDDTFDQGSVADGMDTLLGDAGFDIVSYRGRTTRIFASVDQGGDGALDEWDYIGPSTEGVEGGTEEDVLKAAWASGGPGEDEVNGINVASHLYGGAGRDTLIGYGGDDLLDGGPAEDRLLGGDGNDRLRGDGDADSMTGGAGNDEAIGGPGADVIEVGEGNDRADGGLGDDNIQGEEGDDSLLGGAGSDVIKSGGGSNFADGGEDKDRLQGAGGTDVFNGGSEADQLSGGGGHDALRGGDGPDGLLGGEGADHLSGMEGEDRLEGGDDNDTLFGGDQDDSIFGGAGPDTIHAGEGNDHASGGAGNDLVTGGGGDDGLTGDGGDDRVSGNGGSDVIKDIWYEGGVARAPEEDGSDFLEGGAGNDLVFGLGGKDRLNGGEGDDALSSQGGADELHGGPGDDRIGAGWGNDLIHGDDGHDTLSGEPGDDRVHGDNGNDRLWAGSSVDPDGFEVDRDDRLYGGSGDDDCEGGDSEDSC
ncbi:MAG TPA: Calx-beta domain-containing protein [Actinomycetota bacterium]|nr:Calx-beta domain-containing protein [Actinomycetota bacterium]